MDVKPSSSPASCFKVVEFSNVSDQSSCVPSLQYLVAGKDLKQAQFLHHHSPLLEVLYPRDKDEVDVSNDAIQEVLGLVGGPLLRSALFVQRKRATEGFRVSPRFGHEPVHNSLQLHSHECSMIGCAEWIFWRIWIAHERQVYLI